MKSAKYALGLFVLIGVMAAAGWFATAGSSKPTVVLHTVQPGSVRAFFHASGELAYRNQARLSSELVAKVTRVFVEEGDRVEVGQALIQLDDAPVRAEISQAQAQLARSQIDIARLERDLQTKQKDLDRTQNLLQQGMVSRERLDLSEAATDSAKFLLEASRKVALQDEALLLQRERLLERTLIRAPIRGTVVSIPIKLGETAVASAQGLAGSILMQIAEPSSMAVQAYIAEHDLARVRPGQVVQVMVAAIPNQSFSGKVVQIAKGIENVGEAQKGNAKSANAKKIPVTIHLEHANDNFIAGLSCDLQFQEGGQIGALLIPLSAIRFDEENPLSSLETAAFGARREVFVWAVVDGKASRRPVALGVADETTQEIQSGLKAGDVVVVGPPDTLNRLREGARVYGTNEVSR